MANKRSKKNLTSKQGARISFIISAIYFICSLIYGIISKPTGDAAEFYIFITCLLGMYILILFYYVIFKVEDKRIEEETKKIEIATMQHLSYIHFKEVYFLVKGFGSDVDMIRQILQKEGCKFYARLTENKNIYLIVKDKHNEEVYSAEIENYAYFNLKFKLEE